MDVSHRYRQEVLNVILAQLLEERGIVSAPEEILHTLAEKTRQMPDVLVDFLGLRTAIEGEVDDQPNYAKKALESAQGRVEQGIVHIAVAIVYPCSLREHPFQYVVDFRCQAHESLCAVGENARCLVEFNSRFPHFAR